MLFREIEYDTIQLSNNLTTTTNYVYEHYLQREGGGRACHARGDLRSGGAGGALHFG